MKSCHIQFSFLLLIAFYVIFALLALNILLSYYSAVDLELCIICFLIRNTRCSVLCIINLLINVKKFFFQVFAVIRLYENIVAGAFISVALLHCVKIVSIFLKDTLFDLISLILNLLLTRVHPVALCDCITIFHC